MNAGWLILLTLVAGLTQVSIPLGWAPFDLVLLLAIFTGLWRGGGSGTFVGFAGGIMLDGMVSPVPGLFTLAKGLTGMVADSLHDGLNPHQPVTQLGAMVLLTLLHDLILWQAAQWAALQQVDSATFLFAFACPKAAFHAFAAIPVFFVMSRLVKPGFGRFKAVPRMIRTMPRRG